VDVTTIRKGSRDMTIAHELIVSGRVQGVFFRDSLRRVADAHGVGGWVRNEPNGTVRAYLEGDADAVQKVLDWIREGGPRQARVDAVNVTEREPKGATDFVIRH
jgi:acylphosphatase